MFAADSPFLLLAVVVTLRSVLMAVVIPVRNSLIPNLVPESQVASAVAVDTAVRNLFRILGPAIAGTLLAVMEVADVFWISAFSIVAVLLSLSVVRPGFNREDAVSGDIRADVREAAVYVKNSPTVQSLLILAVVPMVFAFPYTAMMPLFTGDLLHLGPEGLGILLSVAAAGALWAGVVMGGGCVAVTLAVLAARRQIWSL